MDGKRLFGPLTLCHFVAIVVLVLWVQPAITLGDLSVDLGLGDVLKEVHEWIYYKPTPASSEEIRERVPMLATKLAMLAGLNSSLATVLLADGPANTSWMYQCLYKTRQEVQAIFDLIDNIDPNFGTKNNHLIVGLTTRINEKSGLLNKYGEHIDLNDAQVRKSLGKALEKEAEVMQRLSDQIAAALQKP